jgi:hypothetical protein
MEEELILSSDSEIEEEKLTAPKFLFKRDGEKLIIANKGCLSIVGIIYPYKSSFLIEGCDEVFFLRERSY